MTAPPPRRVRLVLATPDGALIGALPVMTVARPWWQDVEPVVQAARAEHGVEVTILRLLEVGADGPLGRDITYLAQTAGSVPAEPWDGALDDHPLRLSYARPGGPAADLAWADHVIGAAGLVCEGPAVQVRTWNLSSLWRIPARGQTLWLKIVPPFFAHEGAVLEALAGAPVPALIGRDGPRILMAEVPGQDLYGAGGAALPPMIDLLVDLQRAWANRTDDLLALGLPDLRPPALVPAIEHVVARNLAAVSASDAAILSDFVAGLGDRLAAVAACGLPDTLVHGDAHPGNLRGGEGRLTLLDWGDCFLGHPLLDEPGFLGRIGAIDVEPCRRHWRALWRAAAPGSDPERASVLLAPVAAVRQAVVYQGFLDRIEPSEHPYHRDDPAERLTHAAGLLRAGAGA